MVKELIVREGKIINGYKGQPTLLGMVDAKGFLENKQNSITSREAKQKALKLSKQLEKKGWKEVTIRAIYSYGYKYPYRYDIESWGGYSR